MARRFSVAGMLSRDQKTMLGFGAVVLLGLMSYWLLSSVPASTVGVMSDGMRVAVMAFVVLFGLLLVILGVLMPLFIYHIYCDVRRMREIADKNEQRIAQMRADLACLKTMWSRQ